MNIKNKDLLVPYRKRTSYEWILNLDRAHLRHSFVIWHIDKTWSDIIFSVITKKYIIAGS